MTPEYFQVITKECGLTFEELENMTIGNALDVVYTYIEVHDPKKQNTRKATQADIDRMF